MSGLRTQLVAWVTSIRPVKGTKYGQKASYEQLIGQMSSKYPPRLAEARLILQCRWMPAQVFVLGPGHCIIFLRY